LRENVEDVADEDGGEQENGVSPSRKRKFYRQKQRNTGVEHGQKNIDAGSVGRVRRGAEDWAVAEAVCKRDIASMSQI
jgi:hypothetical protein